MANQLVWQDGDGSRRLSAGVISAFADYWNFLRERHRRSTRGAEVRENPLANSALSPSIRDFESDFEDTAPLVFHCEDQ